MPIGDLDALAVKIEKVPGDPAGSPLLRIGNLPRATEASVGILQDPLGTPEKPGPGRKALRNSHTPMLTSPENAARVGELLGFGGVHT